MTIFEESDRQYVGIEPGLQQANRMFISLNKKEMESKRSDIELIVGYLVEMMRGESPTFSFLYHSVFGGGSGYEGLKITKPDEFDIDILLKIPKIAGPLLRENNIPGYVNLQLTNFQELKYVNPTVYKDMELFVDDKDYLLTKKMKSCFMQSIFDRVMRDIPDNVIMVGRRRYQITRVQNLGPAFTLTIKGPKNFSVSVDLVPCILLDASQWPGPGFEPNPFSSPKGFFIIPKSPKKDIPHIDRYWGLSFQKQERIIIFDKQWMKPTIRVLKRLRDRLGHDVSSYAIKTMFMQMLRFDNQKSFDETPNRWLGPLSHCVVSMMEVYAAFLAEGNIPYFWNKNRNLIEYLTLQQRTEYKRTIECILADIRLNPEPGTILKYLR